MVLQACGANYHIEEDFLDQTDVDDVVVALVNMAKRVYSSIILMILPYLICYLAPLCCCYCNMFFGVTSICIRHEHSGCCYYLASVQYALNGNFMHRHAILILPNLL